jgi:signal transduction histidine kinase
MSRRSALVVAAGAAGALATTSVVASVVVGATFTDFVESYTLTNLVIGLGFMASGTVIGWARPANPVGVLLVLSGLGHLVTAAVGPIGVLGAEAGWPEPVTRTLATVFLAAWRIGLPGLFWLALLIFPDGRLPSSRWRPLVWVILLNTAFPLVTDVLAPMALDETTASVSIVSVGLVLPEWAVLTSGAVSLATTFVVIGSLVLRYRRGDETTKRQLLWLILAVIAMIVVNAQRWLTGDGPIVLLLSFTLVPIAIAVAIVRYRLLDIRVVLSRTLLYTVLVALVIAVYVGLVTTLSLLVPAEAGRGVAIAAALVVAFAFNPLRLLLQRLITRALYGTRADPASTAARIGASMGRHSDDIDSALEQVRSSLRLPHLELWGADATSHELLLSAVGTPSADGTRVSLPLDDRATGRLEVTLRAGERALHQSDRDTLALVTAPLTLLLRSIALGDQVRAARAATVEARERERAILHRDLHDGLGPTLTSAAFKADAASNVLRSDPAQAHELLGQARVDVRAALAEVRRVVYGLRPLELEERGLLGAIRHRTERRGRLTVTVDAPVELPALSPAVELAAYRIVNEAITNAERHSDGRRIDIQLRTGEDLSIEISDDGTDRGLWRSGVGIASMIERAEEIGGSAVVGRAAERWRVAVTLPL